MAGGNRALLIYDGECDFCRLWVEYWRAQTGGRVHYASAQEIALKFPDVPREKYARAVQLIDEDGARHAGAAAVFHLLSKRPGRGWIAKLYEAPGVAPLSEWLYRLVARHRPFCLKLTRLLWGKNIESSRYALLARLFLQALAGIYVAAFLSLILQLPGLIGERGLLSAETYLQALHDRYGAAVLWLAPTLAWFGAHSGALVFLALIGLLAALLAFGGILVAPCFLLMWAVYLSLVTVGQGFMAFPADLLLLEAGFLAIFLLPFRRGLSESSRLEASNVIIWLYRFLLFRVLFSSGLAKLGDSGLKNLSALSSYLETQPTPTALAWFAHQMPNVALKLLALGMLGVQLVVPFLFLLPRRARRLGAAIMAVFQIMLLLTGHSFFWSVLMLALCLPLLDDAFFERRFPRLAIRPVPDVPSDRPFRKRGIAILAVFIVAAGLTRLALPFLRVPTPALLLAAFTAPFGISNTYDLFPADVMRTEIIFEGSSDGLTWKEYPFKQKPGDVKRAAGLIFFAPRLDWRLWSAVREGSDADPWIESFMLRLLQGSKPVLALLGKNPFPDGPPRYVRAALYVYRFTTAEEHQRDGSWWRRERKTEYLPTRSLGGSSVFEP